MNPGSTSIVAFFIFLETHEVLIAQNIIFFKTGTTSDGEFCSLRTKGETRPVHIWQLIHDAKEAARKLSKESLLEMLKIKSGLSKFYQTFIK